MALKKARKRTVQPYSPAEVTTYPSQAAFNTTVRNRARGQLAPTLDDIRARRKQELGAHTTRSREIGDLYNFDLAARQAAQTRLNEALTGILNRNDVLGSGAQAGLSAALKTVGDQNAAAAQQLGVTVPGTDPQVAATLAAYNKGNSMGLAGDFAGSLARSAADIGITGVERREAGEREMAMNRANLQALDEERTAANKTLPQLQEEARSGLLNEILANSQNKLAWKQFGEGRRQFNKQQTLAEDQFGEQKRARKFDEGEALKQSQLNQDQLDLARDELNAKIDQATTDQDMTNAENAAKQFDSATEWLSGYLAPGDQDMKYNDSGKKVFSPGKWQKRIKGSFNDTVNQLITRFGLDRGTAYTVLSTASIPGWRKNALKFKAAWEMNNRPH